MEINHRVMTTVMTTVMTATMMMMMMMMMMIASIGSFHNTLLIIQDRIPIVYTCMVWLSETMQIFMVYAQASLASLHSVFGIILRYQSLLSQSLHV